jgi:hypothetical protein
VCHAKILKPVASAKHSAASSTETLSDCFWPIVRIRKDGASARNQPEAVRHGCGMLNFPGRCRRIRSHDLSIPFAPLYRASESDT